MAYKGDIAISFASVRTFANFSVFGFVQRPHPVVISITHAVPFSNLHLTNFRGQFVDVAGVNSSGEGGFYDLDDGVYYASNSGIGDMWRAEVNWPSIVVTKVLSSDRTVAYGWAI